MKDLRTIAMSNELVTGSTGELSLIWLGMTLNEIRLIDLSLLTVRHNASTLDNELNVGWATDLMHDSIRITASSYMYEYGISEQYKAAQIIQESIEKIMGRTIKIKKPTEKKLVYFNFLSSAVLDDSHDTEGWAVNIKFHEALIPHIHRMTSDYTLLDFETISRLDTVYSRRLYGLFRYANGYKYKHKDPSGGANVYRVSLKDLEASLGSSYGTHYEFSRRILKPSLERINKACSETNRMYVTYTPIKESRTIVGYEFIYDRMVIETKIKIPKLPARPRVIAGSHLEGEWAQLLSKKAWGYVLECLEREQKPNKTILKKLITAFKIIGDKRYKKIEMILLS